MEILGNVLSVLFMCIFAFMWLYALYQWFVAASNMFAVTKEYKEGINPWGWKTGFNPFNGLVFINWLTPKGKEHAKAFWVAVAKFVVVAGSPFLFAYLFKLATGIVLLGN